MKKLISLSMLLLAFSFVFISCSRDDDEGSSSSNYIQVDNGSKLAVSSAAVMGFKASDASEENFYTITLINTAGTSTKMASLAIYFPYNQSMDGTYTLTSTSRKLDDWLSSYAETIGSTMQSYNDLTQGTCTVKRNSTDNFTVSFSFKTASGKTVNGEFSGKASVQESN